MAEALLEVFSTEAGRCYRFVSAPGGQPQQCREPVVWQGRHRDASGRWYRVWACAGHGQDLAGRRRLS